MHSPNLRAWPANPPPGAETIRAFVALPLPEAVKTALRRVQEELRSQLSPQAAAWTKPENQHLTLRFLGDVTVACLPELCARLRAELSGFGALELVCARLGAFPDVRVPRVLWAGVEDPAARLAELQARVNRAVAAFTTVPAEPQFIGHVTLARPKRLRPADLERLTRQVAAAATRQPFGAWRATTVELIRSELAPTGSRYTTLDVFPLAG